jgi:hypothetical protein
MLRKDESAQMLLSSAFLLAIAIVIITLMLNNVIYSSNVAYVGFMDQTKYYDESIKQSTIKEATFAYDKYIVEMSGDATKYQLYMQEYEDSINRILSTNGRYITINTESYTSPSATPLPYTQTNSTVSIFSKNSKITYNIFTGDSVATATPTATPVPTITITPTPVPNQYIIYLSVSKPNMTISTGPKYDNVTVTVNVVDKAFKPQKGVDVYFYSNPAGGQFGDDPATPKTVKATDKNGDVTIKFYCLNPGDYKIYAKVGVDQSNEASVKVLLPPIVCTHDNLITVESPGRINHTFDGVSYFAYIQTPIKVTGTTNFQGFNVKVELDPSSKYAYETTSMGNIFESVLVTPPDYYKDAITKIRVDKNKNYEIVLRITITAKCNLDGGELEKIVITTPAVTGKV